VSDLTLYVESPSGAFVRDAECDLCGADKVELLAARDRRGGPLRTVVCTRCGLISHEAIPTDEELADYYAHEYRHAYHGERQPSAKRVLRAWNVGRSIYRRLRPFVRPGDQVFEVGAGLGCTVKAFDLAGFEASGIEPGVDFQGFSRQTLHADIQNARLEDVVPVPSYDFVLLVHVIEHFSRPGRALRRIWDLLRTRGRLYVECPNVYGPHAAPGRLFHYAHVYNFTPWTLKMMGESCGFRLVQELSNCHDKSLMFVFEKANTDRLVIDPRSYAKSLAAVQRYNAWSYHCRPRYAIDRIQSLSGLLNSMFFARRRVRRLIARLDQRERETNPAKNQPRPLKAA
jgi:SAM-dependent methyltransferase